MGRYRKDYCCSKTYIFDVMFLHYSDLPSHTALLYLSENALKSFVPARSAFLYRLLSLPSFVEIYGDVYDPISVVFLTAATSCNFFICAIDRYSDISFNISTIFSSMLILPFRLVPTSFNQNYAT